MGALSHRSAQPAEDPERHHNWAEQINAAIPDDGFELLAQPIVPLVGEGPAQFELRLRMRDSHGD